MKPITGREHYFQAKAEEEHQRYNDLISSIELYWEPTRDAQRALLERYAQWFKDREYLPLVQEPK